jgi:hypothetical protein
MGRSKRRAMVGEEEEKDLVRLSMERVRESVLEPSIPFLHDKRKEEVFFAFIIQDFIRNKYPGC